MTFKVPFLSDAQLESAAQELLRRYAKWKGEPPRPPIPVDAIVSGSTHYVHEVGVGVLVAYRVTKTVTEEPQA